LIRQYKQEGEATLTVQKELEKHNHSLRRDLSEKDRLVAQKEGLEEKIKEMNGTVERMAEASAMFRMDSVKWDVHARARDELVKERNQRIAWQSRAELAEGLLVIQEEELEETRERLCSTEEEREQTETALREILAERLEDRSSQSSLCDISTTVDHFVSRDKAVEEQLHQVIEVTMRHNDLSSSYHETTINSLQSILHATSVEHDSLRQSHTELLSSYDTLAKDLKAARTSLHEAEEAHTLCADEKMELRILLEDAQRDLGTAEERCQITQQDLQRLQKVNQADREALKRVNDGTVRWKAAETALLEKIARSAGAFVQVPELTICG
jgi:hypothetical protein